MSDIVTDESMRELTPHGTDGFPFAYYYENIKAFANGSIEWHWHREVELVAVQSGLARCQLGGTELMLAPGDGVLIHSGVFHRLEANEDTFIPNVLFLPEFIAPEGSLIYERFVAPFLTGAYSHLALRAAVPWQNEALARLKSIFALSREASPTWALDVHAQACALWSLLSQHLTESVPLERSGSSMRMQARLRKMTAYIERNSARPLTLEEIARAASISKSEALRCFRSGVNASPIEYLLRHRLRAAAARLRATGDSVSVIALQTGFESAGYFGRQFKRVYGQTPGAYRRQRAAR